MTILPIDEVNALEDKLVVHFEDNGKGRIKSKEDAEDIIDELLDLFLLAYSSGVNATNGELGTSNLPSIDSVETAVNKNIAGKTFRDRVMDYYENGGTLYDIKRIAETDATRIYNQGTIDAVIANDMQYLTQKWWHTRLDDRVRDTHDYLEGVSVPIDAEFYTFDGDHADGPGTFELPENNINCRCWLEIEGL